MAELAAAYQPIPVLVDAGPHQRTWQSVRQVDTGLGLVAETNLIVELQTGINRLTANGWVETSPRIELFEGGAIATNLQIQVIFAPNANTRGAIDILLPDSVSRLTGEILGLA